MKILCSTLNMTRGDWLKNRTIGIGGSDVAAILGLNKYKSPIQVYLEKTGEAELKEGENEACYWGNVMEEVVAQEFAKRTGKKVRRRNVIFQDEEYPFMIANIDREVVGERAVLECKTASVFLENLWLDDEIPQQYLCQVQHYLRVTGYEKAYIAVLIGGNHFVWKEVQRDEELIKMLIELEKDFWTNNVEKKIPPMVDGSEASTKIINAMYEKATEGTSMQLPKEVEEIIKKRMELKTKEKEIKEQINECENKIKDNLQNIESGFTENHKVTWKNVEQNRLDSKLLKVEHPEIFDKYCKTSNYRKLTIK